LDAEPEKRRPLPAGLAPPADLLDTINSQWRLAGPQPTGGIVRSRLVQVLRRTLSKVLGPQETFNAAVVQYINGLTPWRQAMVDALGATLDQCEAALERCDAAVDATGRQREALAARERRIEAGMAAMRATHEELRQSVGVLQQATQMLKHEVQRVAGHAPEGRTESIPTGVVGPSDALGYKYVGFEEQFRGSQEQILERLASYVPIFADASNVLDVGCGRGEFLALLREGGVPARGIDTNPAMVQMSRDQGLQAEGGDALSYLRSQPDQSLGGLFAAQVVEHLEPSYLASFLDAAFDKLRPGAPIVLETINPACWFAFFESYIRDITHVRPLHPDTLKYLLMATGFQRLDIRYRVPYPEREKLQPIPPNATLADSVDTLNGNVEKINSLLFTYLDYAAVGYRP
jgi:2-polyprenyl-3-methyl-5-hydroxy-6-metoxy-1,4-benzoquinol methylase